MDAHNASVPHHVHLNGLALVPMALIALLLLAYAAAAQRERRTGHVWSSLRTASFTLGAVLLALAVSPPVSALAHADLRGHMLQHLVLGMFAPLALVLGAPGTLLLRALPVPAARALTAMLATRVVRALIHPLTAMVLDMGGMALLYLTPLYARSLESTPLHVFIHVHFLVSGYLFTWAVAGPDPAPHRPGLKVRLAALFLGTAVHATVAKLMYAYHFPRNTAHAPHEILEAAKWMYYGGDVAEILLAVVFFSLWFRTRAGNRTGGAAAA